MYHNVREPELSGTVYWMRVRIVTAIFVPDGTEPPTAHVATGLDAFGVAVFVSVTEGSLRSAMDVSSGRVSHIAEDLFVASTPNWPIAVARVERSRV